MNRARATIVALVAVTATMGVVAALLVWQGAAHRAGEARVPVLWVSTNDEHQQTGGVSSATVSVSATDITQPFSIELNTDPNGTTSDSWDAAAAMAAAVATLYSGRDPRGLQVTFAVDDSINGASAGGVLTVGTLAAMRNATVRTDVAMTGTISPDGSLGSVDGIEAKARAAADQGFRTILVPTAATSDASTRAPSTAATQATSTTTSVDVDALSADLGVTVRSVSTVGEAYQVFTGSSIAPTAASPPPLSPAIDSTSGSQAVAAQRALRRQLASARAEGSITRKQSVSGARQLARARQDTARGDTASAYARAISASVVLNQQIASRSAQSIITSEGRAAARTSVIERASALTARAEELLATRSTESQTLSAVQQFGALTAMTWLTRTIAVLRAVTDELNDSDTPISSDIRSAARVVGQYAVVVDRIFPDSLAIARVVAPSAAVNPAEVRSFVAGYSDLLSTAGEANERYYETVLTTISANPDLDFSQPGYLYSTVEQLAANSPTDSNYLSRAAWDFAYFTSSTLLVASAQAYELSGTTIGDLRISATEGGALTIALLSGSQTVDAYAAAVANRELDPGHALWTTQSGDALAPMGKGTLHEVAAAVNGLQLIWDGAVEVFLATAANEASLASRL